MRSPLDLRQTERNSCQSLIVKNVLYTLGCEPPSLRQIDKELDRQPRQLPKRSPIPIWLQYKLRVRHFSTFDPERFIVGGIDYLKEHHGKQWESANELRDYFTPQRIAEYQQYLRTYQEQIKSHGSRYQRVSREPTLDDLNKALMQGAVCELLLKPSGPVPHATMVYDRDEKGSYLIYYPEETYSLDVIPPHVIKSMWKSKRSMSVVWR